MPTVLRVLLATVVVFAGTQATAQPQTSPAPKTEGHLTTAQPARFIVRANAGDVWLGTLDLKLAAGTLTVFRSNGETVKAFELEEGTNVVGFTATAGDTYGIQVAAADHASGAYTLTSRVRTPSESGNANIASPGRDRYQSPRITRLAADRAAGVKDAVVAFWAEAVTAQGPIVEPISGDDKNVLVTFVWRQTFETHQVRLDRPPFADFYMSHLADTDVWYRTMKLLKRTLAPYGFQPNYVEEDGEATSFPDPLNPRLEPARASRTEAYVRSVLRLSEAPDETWSTTTPIARGTIANATFDSKLLQAKVGIAIYTPPGYSPTANRPYPFLILFDGPAYQGVFAAPTSLDNLISLQKIRPVVVAFVSSETSAAGRAENLRLNPLFADAIATEVVPWLRRSYTVTSDPRDAIVGGWSAGANAGLFLALRHPEVFGNVLSQDGGAGIGRVLPDMFLDAPKAPLRIYLDQGVYELRVEYQLPADELAMNLESLSTSVRLRDVLRAKGYDVIYRGIGGAHNPLHMRATLPEALMALLAPDSK